MAAEPPAGTAPDQPVESAGAPLVFRRGKLRPREDDEIRMFREALASLGDIPRVRQILLELGRFYDPVTNGPIVTPSSRRRVIEHLEAGRQEEARRSLEESLTEYTRAAERKPPAPSA